MNPATISERCVLAKKKVYPLTLLFIASLFANLFFCARIMAAIDSGEFDVLEAELSVLAPDISKIVVGLIKTAVKKEQNEHSVDLPAVCSGRLTLTSGTAVTITNVTGGTLFFAPYKGSKISLYDGTRWKLYSFTEMAMTLSGLTSDANYDVFMHDSGGGTLAFSSVAWQSDTSRGTAVTLSFQDGIYVKTGATTMRYLGTYRTTGTATTEDSQTKRFVWNNYNRMSKDMLVTDATANWTQTTASWREARNQTDVNMLQYVGCTTNF